MWRQWEISFYSDGDTTRPRGQEMHKTKTTLRFNPIPIDVYQHFGHTNFDGFSSLWYLTISMSECEYHTMHAGGGSSHVSCKYIDAAAALAALLAAVVDQFFQSKCRHGSSQVGLTPPWLDLTCDPWDIWSECGEDMTWPITKRQRQRRCKSGRSQVSSSCIQKLQKIASIILVGKVQPLWK